jgi:hypothetical protein
VPADVFRERAVEVLRDLVDQLSVGQLATIQHGDDRGSEELVVLPPDGLVALPGRMLGLHRLHRHGALPSAGNCLS